MCSYDAVFVVPAPKSLCFFDSGQSIKHLAPLFQKIHGPAQSSKPGGFDSVRHKLWLAMCLLPLSVTTLRSADCIHDVTRDVE